MNNNKKNWAAKIAGCIVLVAAIGTLLSYIMMRLWNGVLIDVVSVPAISFWQAAGLLILSKILFGGIGGKQCSGGGPRSWKRHWQEKCEEKLQQMAPEEREKIKEEWRNRCRVWRKQDDEKNEPL